MSRFWLLLIACGSAVGCGVLPGESGRVPPVRVGVALEGSDRVQVLTARGGELQRVGEVVIAPLKFSSATERLSPPTLFDLNSRSDAAIRQHLRQFPNTQLVLPDSGSPHSKSGLPSGAAVMELTLLEFEDRQGSRGGSERGADVFLEARVKHPSDGAQLFLARYVFREQPITDNVLGLSQKLRDQQQFGAGFKPAPMVFERGVAELLATFERQQR